MVWLLSYISRGPSTGIELPLTDSSIALGLINGTIQTVACKSDLIKSLDTAHFREIEIGGSEALTSHVS